MIAALIPVKDLAVAKSRLVETLSDCERRRLVLTLLRRTADALSGSGVVARIAVTTPERAVADGVGAEWIPDAGSLNASLLAGVRWAIAVGAAGLLVVPADLPLITAADIEAVVAAGADHNGVTIAPCLDGGTGALLLRPPDAISPCFGPNSHARHLKSSARAGLRSTVVCRAGLAHDLDTPADLDAFRATRV
jgi:2-phospho-L-lactate guanylyltransferase